MTVSCYTENDKKFLNSKNSIRNCSRRTVVEFWSVGVFLTYEQKYIE